VSRFFFVLFFCGAAHAGGYAIVLQDDTALRPAPGAAARPNAVLYQGETVEVRGERLDYLQVWDYSRERGGYVRASQVRRLAFEPAEAPELLAILRFLRGMPGSEALGIGIAAAYIEAAPPAALEGAEVLDIMGVLAERLARKGYSSHLDVAARYGVRFVTVERNGRLRLCYDGAAYRRLLAMRATEEQRARAMLALSEPSCMKPEPTLAQMLDRADESALPGYLRNRILMRRASVWASVAYQRARQGEDAAPAAERAAKAFLQISKEELAEADRNAYADVQTRVGAIRVALARPLSTAKAMHIATAAGEPGQTCVMLLDGKKSELARRCTYGHVWPATAVVNGAASALAVAVQPTESWRELWVFRKSRNGWTVRVVPPAASSPGVGYAEFAGWTSGGIRVTRQAIVGGRLQVSKIMYPVRNSAAS
jgi:hypothetical protein